MDFGFKIELVLADSLYGESRLFIQTLDQYDLHWILAIRSNHGVLMPSHQKVRANKWCKFERVFSNKKSETRYIREIIFGKRHKRTYWEITTDPETLPDNSTSFVMTNIQDKMNNIKKTLGNSYGLRTWVEYGFRQCKQELGWTDYRFTDFKNINKWWEIIMSAYLMISLHSLSCLPSLDAKLDNLQTKNINVNFYNHPQWHQENGWKNVLNNFRLVIQPTLLLWLIYPWLEIFPNSSLLLGFHDLINLMNQFQPLYYSG